MPISKLINIISTLILHEKFRIIGEPKTISMFSENVDSLKHTNELESIFTSINGEDSHKKLFY